MPPDVPATFEVPVHEVIFNVKGPVNVSTNMPAPFPVAVLDVKLVLVIVTVSIVKILKAIAPPLQLVP